MGNRFPPTEQELATLQQLCAEQPNATIKHLAKQWGRSAVTTSQYLKRLRLGNAYSRVLSRSLQCPEPLKSIFLALDLQGKSLRTQARELGIGTQTLGRYRRGEQSPSLYLVMCLAQMARIELRAEYLQEKESV